MLKKKEYSTELLYTKLVLCNTKVEHRGNMYWEVFVLCLQVFKSKPKDLLFHP